MNRYRKSWLYIIVRPIISFLFKIIFMPSIEGRENIPCDGKVILAGNHTSNLDCLLLMSSTKREIHFLAKSELFKGLKGVIFKNMGLIPVDRRKHNPEAIEAAIKYLNNDEVVGIFPEGTTEKGKGLLPFKLGYVRIANKARTPIVVFVIKGKYIPFKRIRIKFLKSIMIKDDINEENNYIRDLIDKELKEV